jgi:uncharacterized protein (TIGR02569 family)
MYAPPPAALEAFGVTAVPKRLDGGQGTTYRAGDVVLKPAEGPLSRWRAEVLSSLPGSARFRVPRPLRTRAGGWVAAGWEAMGAVAGDPTPHRPDQVIAAGTAFHQALASLPAPAILAERNDPWSYADRLAWNEPVPTGTTAPSALLEPLLAARRPVSAVPQLVHGDLLGNVLFAPGLPPAIIDWSPYWRPPAWAYAVAVIDALCWHGAGPDLITRYADQPSWPQMLLRALIFRIATWDAAGWHPQPSSVYEPVASLALTYAQTGALHR